MGSLSVLSGNSLRAAKSLGIQQNGALTPIKTLRVQTSSGLSLVFSSSAASSSGSPGPLAATVSPDTVTGQGTGLRSRTVQSNPATVTPSGGIGPYSYQWTVSAGQIVNPTSATTAFQASLPPGQQIEATASCVVTDFHGQTAAVAVDVILAN